MTTRKPIRRNEHIVPLSRDHHMGLLFCWKIRQGIRMNAAPERIRKYVHFFWEELLQEHFRQEETILFQKISDPLCEEGFRQHREIKALIGQITGSSFENQDYGLYEKLVDMVDDHIRFEERTLFPFLESSLTAAQLAAAGSALTELHAVVPKDYYPDEFWVQPRT